MGKVKETQQLYNEVIKEIITTKDNWLSFLGSASWNFKYHFDDQVLIYAQRPNAKACASMEIWNKKVHRWVNKDANVIFVISKDEDSKYPFRLVFDVSDTHNYMNTPYKLWEVKEEYENEIIENLCMNFGDITTKDDFAQAIKLIAYNIVADNIQDYLSSIHKYKSNTELEKMSDDEIQSIFLLTVWSSVAYMMMKRCNINMENEIDNLDFSFISKFSNDNIATILGTAVSEIAQVGLREIAKTVINLQKEEKRKNRTFVKNQNKDYSNSKENIEGGFDYDRTRIHESGRLQYSESNNEERNNINAKWKIRQNEATLSKGIQKSRIYDTLERQETSKTFDGNTGNSTKKNRVDSKSNEKEDEYNRRIENPRPDGVGGQNEQYSSDSRTDSNKRSNLQLEYEQNEEEVENTSFFNEETIKNILKNAPNVIKNEREFTEFIYDNHEDKEKCKAYIKEILGNAYTEFEVDDKRVGYKANNGNLNLWTGNYLNRTEECFENWDLITDYCISNIVHYAIPEYNKDTYTFIVGDTIYLGFQEFTILDLDNGTMTIYDNQFPLDQRTVVINDIIQKIAENPMNDYLKDREKPEIQEKVESAFNKWLDTFIEEKGIDLGQVIEIKTETNTHYFEIGNIIDNIKATTPEEQAGIKDMIVKIDFHNGDVVDYFRHLAQALAENYEKQQEQPKEVIPEEQIKETKEQELIAEKLIKKNRNIEYFDLHPEIPTEERNNFKITDDNLGVGTAKEKYKNNVEAIKILKLCEEQNRYATPEEQQILSKYVGWGGLKSAFEDKSDSWASEYAELKELLTEDEYKDARASSVTAYYTPPVVIRNIYKALHNMGLKQANILEPSCRRR